MSANDYVKFVTQQIVSYIDQPREKRKEERVAKKEYKEPLSNRWFGVIPLAISMLLNKKK
jgi:hypothetical protein